VARGSTLFMVTSRAEAANDVLKPYVVMILDTSGSMAEATGSGPTTCGKPDLKLNHAVCAINSIVNSYGEMVFALGRFRETTSGVGTAGSQVCDANGDQRGNVSNSFASPSGGDVCNTQGQVCSDCDPSVGLSKTCEENADCTSPNLCVTAAETACGNNLDDDGDGRINDGCPAVATGEGTNVVNDPDCDDNDDNDSDGTINDGCPAHGRCDDQNNFGCKNTDNGFEVLTSLVDGNNALAAEFTDGSCNACSTASAAGTINPEIWGVGSRTFTPLSSSMKGAQRYWEGITLSTDGSALIWPATTDNMTNNPGYDPINRDPAAAVFLPTPGNDSCNPNPNVCTNTPGCVGPACCCATQCRPYITILLTDGGETCTTSANTVAAAADLAVVTPRADAIAIASISRTGNVVTVTTEPLSSTGTVVLPHAFKLGDQIFIAGTGLPAQTGGTYFVTGTCAGGTNVGQACTSNLGCPGSTCPAPSATQLQYRTVSSGTIATTNNTAGGVANSGTRIAFMSVRHTASFYAYNNQVKPIGFGIAPGNQQIEDIAHAGGAPDVPGINEGYYAQDEADLQLAISQILADSVRAETCNGSDDDCDTRVDEDFPTKGQACTNGQVGACVRSGTLVCSVNGLVCNAPVGTPTQEICNNIDDDCDGFIDETSERGAECTNNLPNDDVTDGVVNDGCPAGGPSNAPETACNDAVDSDSDGLINDGCPPVGTCNVCVPTTEICDNADNDCDGVADQICRCVGGTNAGGLCSVDNQAGGPCAGSTCDCVPLTRPCGIGVCGGIETCTGNNTWTGCTAATPTNEECDGDDDDCDGVCDGITLDCSTQNGPCTNASGSCPASASLGSALHYPSPDTAESGADCTDAVDDDLDGLVNDGCPADGAAESGADCADAIDNDTDGDINDGCPVPALPIAQNVCRPGSRTCAQSCTPGNTFTQCFNEVGPCTGPDCDGCNGLDDDCDNKIDEDFIDQDCSTNCGIGRTVCVAGQIQCNSTAQVGDPTCNGIDDDCDLKFDEDWLCVDTVAPTGNRPTTCDPCGIRNLPGQPFNPAAICDGTQKCQNGQAICDGAPANPESCNCVDDDCDGVVDEDPDPSMSGDQICGTTGGTCVSCQCAFGCAQGEFPCPLGKKCETQAGGQQYCVNDPCFNVTCGPVNGNAQTCIPKPNFPNEAQCVDICSLVNDSDTSAPYAPCTAGTVCVGASGECRPDTCETFPERCTATQSCVNGTCVTNPCQGVTCDGGTYCLAGECVASCADVTCPSGQRCRQGTCEADPCGKQCPFGQACNDSTGQCIEDPCKFRNCPQGQWCNPNINACEDDPCVTSDITCPNAGEVCRGGTCLDPSSISVDAAGESHVTVGGGGGCNTSGGSGGLLLLLGALGLAVSRRRRTVGGAL